MTTFRLMSLSAHAATELVLGLFTVAAPFIFGFGGGATIVTLAIGALLVGLALSAVDHRSTSVAAHSRFDTMMAMAALAGALVLGAGRDAGAAAVLCGVGIAQFALTLTTRYSARA